MPRRSRPPTPPPKRKSSEQISRQIRDALADITHELHVAEREIKDTHPMIAARLRAIRVLVSEVRAELRG
jgi:hypothetical protein